MIHVRHISGTIAGALLYPLSYISDPDADKSTRLFVSLISILSFNLAALFPFNGKFSSTTTPKFKMFAALV